MGVLLANLKYALVLLKFGTLLSMLISLVAYAWFFGWPFAVGFVLLLFIHEMGHYLAARCLGVPVSAPVFLPFLGAVINMRGKPEDVYREAQMAYAGPLAGVLASFLVYLAGRADGSSFLLTLAQVGFFLNLFNLLPVYPLDGGRVASAVSLWFWFAGIPLATFLLWWWRSPLLIIVLLLALVQMGRAWKERDSAYYHLPLGMRLQVALAYFGLILLAGWGLALATVPAYPG